jgi:hypothetical protein
MVKSLHPEGTPSDNRASFEIKLKNSVYLTQIYQLLNMHIPTLSKGSNSFLFIRHATIFLASIQFVDNMQHDGQIAANLFPEGTPSDNRASFEIKLKNSVNLTQIYQLLNMYISALSKGSNSFLFIRHDATIFFLCGSLKETHATPSKVIVSPLR